MEAGIEHLGRATAKYVDALLVVVGPGQRSAQTARVVEKLAADIGIGNVYAVLNRFSTDEQEKVITELLPGLPVLGKIGEYATVREADLQGRPVWETAPDYMSAVKSIWKQLES